MTKFILTLILFFTFFTLSYAKSANPPPVQDDKSFQLWVSEFKKTALERGISAETLDSAFKEVKLNSRILELDRRQPEFFSTFWQYFNRATSETRVRRGKEMYKKHLPLLSQVTKKYGVPERILVAFWGLETNYGSYTGYNPIIEALATLAYDPRRSTFFTSELLSALTIIDRGYVDAAQMKGSWAGAMGQCQFMPSNYLRYAVDADNDGKKDLWGSYYDIFHSMGNFLNILGWEKDLNWGEEVTLPKDFDLMLANGKTRKDLAQWQALGIKLANGKDMLATDKEIIARLVLPSDYRGPAFLVYNNFSVIKRWNNSTNYALAVGHLADRIVGLPALTKSRPDDDKSLSREQVVEMQTLLLTKGLDLGKADGIAGRKTRQALREFQYKIDVPTDGFPSYRMLNILREHK